MNTLSKNAVRQPVTLTPRAGAAALALFIAGAHAAASAATNPSLEQLRQISSSWDADLTVAVEGGKRNVELGDTLRYHLNAREDGVCYLIHVDTSGESSLMRPSDCSNVAASGSYFPSSGKLEAAEPVGKETVFAVLLPGGSVAAETLLGETQGYVQIGSSDLNQLVSDLGAASASGQLAIAETSYYVGDAEAMAESGLQYTTRGIIRKVVEETSEESTLEEAMNEIAFDVQSINFEFGSADLTADGMRQLDEFGAAMQSPELGNLHLRVEGHTDDLGEAEYNLDLSQQRASAVAQYLYSNYGIERERLDVLGLGEESPLIPDTSLEARAKNRRVEMVFLKP
jgi:outer membrane protein OmpA-like peptidoglycan-associated protein